MYFFAFGSLGFLRFCVATKELSSICHVTRFAAYDRFAKGNRLRTSERFVQASARNTWKSVTINGGTLPLGQRPIDQAMPDPPRCVVRYPVEKKWGKRKWLGQPESQMQIEMYQKRDKDGTSSVESGQCGSVCAGCKSLFTLINALCCVNGVRMQRGCALKGGKR